ncbi:hypothetical protein AQUCO_03300060v1 [Aquilegia coerulea]|uniref:Dof zinc finger protein n=1 Tax=Aquilegia coerulea TaxID=218851 RepID=A0A2G5D078_AQUCA|nr:hypothetical protein AQUCO_03300060v1 [Aquilegia coerulea]
MEKQGMGAMEDQQQRQQLVEVQPCPRRRCPRCNSLETMFGYYSIYRDNQPRNHCKICSHYWTQEEMPRGISIGSKRKTNQHSDAASSSTNRVCKIPRSVENVFQTSGSDVRINRRDPVSRILAAEGNAPSNPSPFMRINEPRTLHASLRAPVTQSATIATGSGLWAAILGGQSANQLLSGLSGGVNQHLYPHSLHEQPQQQQEQQHLYNSQNSWEGNTLVMRSTNVWQFQPRLYNIGSVSNPEALLWSNNNNIGQLRSQGTPFPHSTGVPDFQDFYNNVGRASDPEANLFNNNSNGIGGLPVNPLFWPDNPKF